MEDSQLITIVVLGFVGCLSSIAMINVITPIKAKLTCQDMSEPHRWSRNVLTDELQCTECGKRANG